MPIFFFTSDFFRWLCHCPIGTNLYFVDCLRVFYMLQKARRNDMSYVSLLYNILSFACPHLKVRMKIAAETIIMEKN